MENEGKERGFDVKATDIDEKIENFPIPVPMLWAENPVDKQRMSNIEYWLWVSKHEEKERMKKKTKKNLKI